MMAMGRIRQTLVARCRVKNPYFVRPQEKGTMRQLAPYLLAGSAAIVLLLGVLHLLYTFRGPKLVPRDAELQERMRVVSPVITRETTTCKAWVVFNSSHSFGAILFGLVYGYLALLHPVFLFESVCLPVVGLVVRGGDRVRGGSYWFSVSCRGFMLLV